MVSMSSTSSPISSGPMKAGTHNSSMTQRSWRHSLYLLILLTWRVAEIEFQCRLARFVISNKGVMRCYLAGNINWGLNGNMIYLDGKGDQLPGKRGAPDGKCCVAGARNEKKECQIYAAEHRWRLRSVQTSGGALKRGGGSGVRNEITECQSR